MKKEERESIVTICDAHAPYIDYKALCTAVEFAKYLNPEIVIIHEFCDWYALSKFDKDPQRRLELQKDLDKAVEALVFVRLNLPHSRIIMLRSNHDQRLSKYLRSKAPEIEKMRSNTVPQQLALTSMDIEYMDYFVFRRSAVFKHGGTARKYSGYSAKAELDKEGMSGASGHTHRLGQHYKRNRSGFYTWLECGCVCKLDAEYLDDEADWQHGMGVFSFRKGSAHFDAKAYAIIDGEILYGRKSFDGKSLDFGYAKERATDLLDRLNKYQEVIKL